MSKGKKTKRPISKKTSYLLEDLARKRNVRELSKRYLIVCEDDKSAPTYFETLKSHFRLDATKVQVEGSKGSTQPLLVAKRAIAIKNAAKSRRSGTTPFDEVWCLIDGDYGHAIHNARSSANAHGILLAISNKCFEYWVLLHFRKATTPTADCDGLVEMVRSKGCIPDYSKGGCDYSIAMENVGDACDRAKEIREDGLARGIQLPENQNPCSEVYMLVNKLLDRD